MNYKEYLIKRLKTYTSSQIIISTHAMIRLAQRQITKSEIMENILNPERLKYAIRLDSSIKSEEKFDCYFGYSRTLCHRYILVIKNDIVVITVIKINRRWQSIVEKKIKTHIIRGKK